MALVRGIYLGTCSQIKEKLLKPLTNLEEFLERFDNFKDSQFRSIEVISPTTISITLAGQDKARAYDWITLTLQFDGVSDARLHESSKLPLLDMSDGVSILNLSDTLAFGIGECYNISSLKNSSCFIEAKNIKYEEGSF